MRLFRLLRLRQIFLLDPPTREEASDLTVAMHHCKGCTETAACDRLLAEGQWQALRTICPNSDYLEKLARRNEQF